MANILTNIMLLALVAGSALLWSRHRRFGAVVVSAVTMLALLIAVAPISRLMLWPLEHRFSRFTQANQTEISGIILLGGGAISASLTELMGHPVPSRSIHRVKAFVELEREFPDARLFVAGGGTEPREAFREAPLIRRYLAERGVDQARITIESESRNTFENAVFSRDIVNPEPTQTWLLVTTARHMPRAVASFRNAGWNVVAVPTGPLVSEIPWSIRSVNLRRGIGLLGAALHEYVGLLAYRLSGRTATVWPAA